MHTATVPVECYSWRETSPKFQQKAFKQKSHCSVNAFAAILSLQEREKDKIILPKEIHSIQLTQTESGMFYELSNKRRMECERYQDCSWFQQDSMKKDICSKLSLAETVEPIIDTNEYDLAMQFANAQTIPWGDEYLEVFDDDILLEEKEKMGEKNKNIANPSNENYTYANYKGEDSVYNTYNVNFSLRKTDSFDSMKVVSSTNPAEIIPISYKERINNSNYSLTMLSGVKSEVKEELKSPESETYVMDSDDSDLNIGREEVVGEVCLDKEKFCANSKVAPEIPLSEVLPVITPNKSCEKAKNENSLLIKSEHEPIKPSEKLDLNLDLNKVNFDQSMNVSTPDLDFMDLVEYINEEMLSDPANSNPITSQNNKNSPIKLDPEIQPLNTEIIPIPQVQVIPQANESITEVRVTDTKEDSTVDFDQITDTSISIAERIKTSAKRRTPRKYNIKDVTISEDEEDFESADDDEDYDYREDTVKRRFAPLRKRSKSSASESSISGKKVKEDIIQIDSYRERRDKNNEASRRSRQNRKDRERHMFETLEEEERRNVKLKAEAEILEKQVVSLRQLLLQVVLKKGAT